MPVAGQELARNASGIDWAARSRFLYQMTRGVADQGLAFLWLHPESVMDTADRKIRGFNMMGYRLNTPDEPDFGERQWNSYPSVFFPRGIVSPATGDYEVEYYPFVSICLDTEGMSAPTVL
ncbi:hypothetical protein KKB18_02605 [bacterium]|nr:hypothetical protein [bacterium]